MTSTTVTSSGSERFGPGTRVVLRNVSGHRDTGLTSCPGTVLYGRLNALAAKARSIGLPKIFEPRVDEVESVFRFRARISSTAPWVVSIKTRAGVQIAQQAGTGTAIDWTWDASLVPSGRYTWTSARLGAPGDRSAADRRHERPARHSGRGGARRMVELPSTSFSSLLGAAAA